MNECEVNMSRKLNSGQYVNLISRSVDDYNLTKIYFDNFLFLKIFIAVTVGHDILV